MCIPKNARIIANNQHNTLGQPCKPGEGARGNMMNTQEFVQSYMNRIGSSDAKLENRLVSRVQHAMDVLDSTGVGEKVVFEGACPSGSTYEGCMTWDGAEATRQEIANAAIRYGGFHAWAAWLQPVRGVEDGIFQAKMRTG